MLFIVTDGVEDEINGGIRLIQKINGGTATNYCNTIKGRGIKIAVLYTEYLPVPANSFYVSNVEPFQSQIGPALQACASTGLFYDAAIGADPRPGALDPVPGRRAGRQPDTVSVLGLSAGFVRGCRLAAGRGIIDRASRSLAASAERGASNPAVA